SSGSANVTATVDDDNNSGTAQIAVNNGSPVVVRLKARRVRGAANGSLLSGTNTTRTADGSSAATLSLQLKDVNGNTITTSGVAVTFATTRGTLSSTTATTNSSGIASVTLTSTSSGSANVTATVDDDNNSGTAQIAVANGSPVVVTFNPGAISGAANGSL